MMRRIRHFVLLAVLLGAAAVSACERCRQEELKKQGVLFHGWKVAPLQAGLGIDGVRNLADKDGDTVFTFGLWQMFQGSAVFSLCTSLFLKANYGVELSPLGANAGDNYGIQLGLCSETGTNRGLSVGLMTASGFGGNRGVRIGVFNITGLFDAVQFVGVNCCDILHLALINHGRHICQIGALNSGEAAFQLGVLNYNPRSYIPWLPLVNFTMKPKEEEYVFGDAVVSLPIPIIVTEDKEKNTTEVLAVPPAAPKRQ